jgi:hypothetical protein
MRKPQVRQAIVEPLARARRPISAQDTVEGGWHDQILTSRRSIALLRVLLRLSSLFAWLKREDARGQPFGSFTNYVDCVVGALTAASCLYLW